MAYVGALIGALIYTMNPLTTVLMYDFIGLFSYALLPLTFYLTRSALRQNSFSFRVILKYAILLSLVLTFATTMYHMFTLHVIVLGITGLSELIPRLVTRREQVKRYLFYCFGLTGLTLAFFTLLSAYFLLPFGIMQSPEAMEYRHLFISSDSIIGYSVKSQWQNVIRGFGYLGEWGGLYDSSSTFRSLWLVSTMVVPILAFAAIIRKFKNKDVIILSLLILIGIFLAKGPNEPFGDQYLWLTSHFELPFTTGGLYYPARSRPLIYLPYALLSALMVVEILKGINLRKGLGNKFVSVTTIVLVCGFISISAFPILSGDARGTMNPMTVPQPYQDMNEWLDKDEGDYRVAWLPPSGMIE